MRFPDPDRQVLLVNRSDIIVVDRHQKTAMVIDVAGPRDSNIKKREHEKLKKYQSLQEETEMMRKVKAKVVLVL